MRAPKARQTILRVLHGSSMYIFSMSTHLLNILERSGHINLFNLGFKVAITHFGRLTQNALKSLLPAFTPKYPLLHFGSTRVRGFCIT